MELPPSLVASGWLSLMLAGSGLQKQVPAGNEETITFSNLNSEVMSVMQSFPLCFVGFDSLLKFGLNSRSGNWALSQESSAKEFVDKL